MKNMFYKLAVSGLIAKKYSDLALRDLFWDYDVDEHSDNFLVEVENLVSSEKLTARIKIPRRGAKRSFLESATLLLETLEEALDWYTKEETNG